MGRHHKVSTFSLTQASFYFWFDAVLIVISMSALIADFFRVFNGYTETIILFIIAILGLLPVFISAVRALINFRLTIDLLASIALIFALLTHEWKSAVFISLMLASARFFAYFTENRTKNAIRSLLKLRPEKAHVKVNGNIVEKDIKEIKLGDLVVVDSGERVAIDGIIETGSASIDQSSLTGESEPVYKTKGDEVLSSTLNVSGSIIVKVTKVGEDTTFSKILKLIDESQQGRAKITVIADRFTGYYIFATIILAVVLYFIFNDLLLILSVLLVTCADDLAVAIPLAFLAAISVAARKGIIIKGGSYIESFSKVKAIVLDKTGTLTLGKPMVKNVSVFRGHTERELLALVLSGACESSHPASKAVCLFVKNKKIKIKELSDIFEEPGYGIKGVANGKPVYIGKPKFLSGHGVKFLKKEKDAMEKEMALGRTMVVAAFDKKPVGFISLADAVHHEAAYVIDELRKKGMEKIVMLTGDNERVANQVAKEVHISEFRANLLPQNKVDLLKDIITKKYKTAMVGDGINDAAALASADIGIAMGVIGSDAAIEAADIALMKDRLTNLLDLTEISRYTMKIVYQNLALWAVINAIGLILVFAGFLNPSGAAAFNFITDFIPLLNSLRIFKKRF